MGGKNKRAHLIETGQEIIWSKGYDLCSVKDITNAAGLPKGSFYHYFESKEKFALEAMNHFIEKNAEALPTEDGIASFEEIIDRRIASIIQINYTRECYMSVMCHAYSEQEDAFRQEVISALDASNKSMHELLHQLKKEALIREDLDIEELLEFIDFSWRGARLKARLLKSEQPLQLFKSYLSKYILVP